MDNMNDGINWLILDMILGMGMKIVIDWWNMWDGKNKMIWYAINEYVSI